MITKVHHVGVVVRDIEQAMRFYRDLLGLPVHKIEVMRDQGVRAALLTLGTSEIELLEPVVTDNGVARYLERKGEGLHHVCFEVDDVERHLTDLKMRGTEMIDQQTRIGLAGRICFLHPNAMDGALIELCQPLGDEAPHVAPFGSVEPA
jgi:methylmalonyl-CoA/ethylmalonyl-CoA epimerase